MLFVVNILIVILASILGITCIWYAVQIMKNKNEYVPVTATCIEVRRIWTHRGIKYYCKCKYLFEEKEYEAHFQTNLPYRTGEVCKILINPKEPSRYLRPAEEEFSTLIFLFLIPLALAYMLLVHFWGIIK